MPWDLSCPDWEGRIRAGRSLVPDLPLNHVEAERAVRIFNRLRLADVPGNPTLGEAAGDWFRDIVRALFGSWDEAAKERHIREILALVPKKNSKTSYGAGLMMTALLLNKRPKGKFLLVAPTQDVTELAFGQCQGMIELDPFLGKRMKVQQHLKRITDTTTGATLEVMSFDPNVLTGQKPTGFLVDELHVVAKSAKATSAVGQLRGGMIAQPEAFGLFITTQSEKPPAGVFRSELQRARAIRDGRAVGPMLAVLYEFPQAIAKDQERWSDPRNWHMVTPNAGRSITVERLVQEFATAQQLGTEEVQRWSSQHLNIEIGLGLGSDRWVGADLWEAAEDAEPVTLEALLERCEVIVAGGDGGGADDLLGLVLLGREKETRDWLAWGKAWAQNVVLERRKQIASVLRDFEMQGDLAFVEEPGPEVDEFADVVARVHEAGLLAQVGLDPMGIGEIVDALIERGIPMEMIIGIPQGWRMSGAIKTTERKLANKTLRHGGQPIMAWNVGNAKAEPKGNATSIDKAVAGSAKIDLLVSLFNAVALMSKNPEARGAYDMMFVG